MSKAVDEDRDWNLIRRTDGKIHRTVKARDLWRQIAEAIAPFSDPSISVTTGRI